MGDGSQKSLCNYKEYFQYKTQGDKILNTLNLAYENSGLKYKRSMLLAQDKIA